MKARFKIQGKQELQFWLRAFQLNPAVERSQKDVADSTDTQAAITPIITQYICGRLYWQVFLMTEIDALGLVGGNGVLWLSDNEAERNTQIEECAKMANDVLPRLHAMPGMRAGNKYVFKETPREL